MLAAHLSRLAQGKPARYAHAMNDPAVTEALSNYVRLKMRATNIPPLLHYLNQHHPPYQEAAADPTVSSTLSSLTDTGHPGDLFALLDLLREREVGDVAGVRELGHLANSVGGMIQNPPKSIVQGFTTEAMRHPDLNRALVERVRPNQSRMESVLRVLNNLLGRHAHPAHFHSAGLMNSIMHGDSGGVTPALAQMYDLAHLLNVDPKSSTPLKSRAVDARDVVGHTIAGPVLSALNEYGMTGRFPSNV